MTLVAGARWWVFGVMDELLPDPPGKPLTNVHPRLAEIWRRVHQRHPSHTNSARRTTAEQQEFYDCYQARLQTGHCPPGCGRSQCSSASQPGFSNHEFGLAIDGDPLDGDRRAWSNVCREEGLIFPIGNEPWHVQESRVTTSFFDGFPDDWRPDR